MAQVVLEGVTKAFGDVVAVDDITLSVDDGEFLVLVGPSGCGKSTILRIIAGLEDLTAGEVRIGDRQVTFLPPKDRDVAMVFQNYALYPHMTVAKNLSFGLRLRKTPKAERNERVEAVAETLGLGDLMERKPGQLSGGQRQRVAMGRAMVREPQAFLMDEPLSNLDAKLRIQLRAELVRLHERLGTTTIYVTHDQVEAMTLGHRVAVILDGVLQQVDTPHALYAAPANLFVATFIGSPPMNLVEARVGRDTIAFGGFELPSGPTDLSAYEGGTIIVGIRPSDLEDHSVWQAPGLPVIEVTAEVTEDIGSEVNVMFRVDAPPVDVGRGAAGDEEDGAGLLMPTRGCVFCARVDARTSCSPGSTIALSLDPTRFHYFDPATGLAIAAPEPVSS